MKTKFYTICKQSRCIEWANPNNVLSNHTSKAEAKREAKQWAAALRQTVSVYRVTVENISGKDRKTAEYIGQAECAAWLCNMELTPADICGNWCE